LYGSFRTSLGRKHLVGLTGDSLWPIVLRLSVAGLLFSNIIWWRIGNFWFTVLVSLVLCSLSFLWRRDLGRESNFLGKHTRLTQVSLKVGMAFFIFSEVMFFFRFFWTYLHFSLNPVADVGLIWPAVGTLRLDPLSVPLLNTLILVSSGATLTVSHHLLMVRDSTSVYWLMLTLGLGVFFTICQLFEYGISSFMFFRSNYGRIFFIATGFHGLHVFVGSLLLFISLLKMCSVRYTRWHHVRFELSAWYWHFVDVVWLFLYTIVYWWSS